MFIISFFFILILAIIISIVLKIFKKPDKSIAIVFLCAFLLIGYNSFTRFTPIYIPNSDKINKQVLSEKLVRNYLNYKKFAWLKRITDYKINTSRIDTTYVDRYTIFSSFSVKPINGGAEDKGWIKDKCIFFTFGRIGNLYLTYSDWNTGP